MTTLCAFASVPAVAVTTDSVFAVIASAIAAAASSAVASVPPANTGESNVPVVVVETVKPFPSLPSIVLDIWISPGFPTLNVTDSVPPALAVIKAVMTSPTSEEDDTSTGIVFTLVFESVSNSYTSSPTVRVWPSVGTSLKVSIVPADEGVPAEIST